MNNSQKSEEPIMVYFIKNDCDHVTHLYTLYSFEEKQKDGGFEYRSVERIFFHKACKSNFFNFSREQEGYSSPIKHPDRESFIKSIVNQRYYGKHVKKSIYTQMRKDVLDLYNLIH